LLITFEGVDGCGKSTQVRLLDERLNRAGAKAVVVREPGGTELSEAIRELLLRPTLAVSPTAELLLFSAARAQLVTEVIRPALEAGRVVICDRFTDSTLAYQGGGRALADPSWIRGLNGRATGGLIPARTYYLAVEPAVARSRATTGEDRMEAAGEEFYARVVRAYEQLADREPERVTRLDGTAAVEDIHERIWTDIVELLGRPELAETGSTGGT